MNGRTWSEVKKSLGRNLAACGTRVVCSATANVPLLEPYTQFEPRRRVVDLRVAKNINLGGSKRLNASVSLNNALNASDTTQVRSAYGAEWRRPITLQAARLVSFAGTLSF